MSDHEHGLGRLHIPDDRDASYPMQSVLPAEAPERKWRYWTAGWRGDQGATPQCVAYSWLHWLEAMHRPGIPDVWDPEALYKRAQRVDQWPGENYDGTSVRAGAKVLQAANQIRAYHWAKSVRDIIAALLTKGPVVVGTAWHESMFEPDSNGVLRIDGPVVGGHAYLLDGVTADQSMFRFSNSWGPNWGKGGRAWVAVDDFSRLLADDGEACLPVL